MTANGSMMLGESAILRMGGIPVGYWLECASPYFFHRVREHESLARSYSAVARQLAKQIGEHLISRSDLSAPSRRMALAVRRQMHNARLLTPRQGKGLLDVVAVGPAKDLEAHARAVISLSNQLSESNSQLESLLGEEETRSRGAIWRTIERSHLLQITMRTTNETLFDNVGRHLGAGRSWSSKELRRAEEALSRLIARGAAKATPRGWLSHVALMAVQDASGALPMAVRNEFLRVSCENVFLVRATLEGATVANSTDVTLFLTPLMQTEPEAIFFWKVGPRSVLKGRICRTCVVDRVVSLLKGRALSPSALMASVVAKVPGVADESLVEFIDYLLRIGFLHWSASPSVSRSRVTTRNLEEARVPPASVFVDVFRKAVGEIDPSFARRVESVVLQYTRLVQMIREDQKGVPSRPLNSLEEPRRSVDLVMGELYDAKSDSLSLQKQITRTNRWPAPKCDGSPYSELFSWLNQSLSGSDPAFLSQSLLDQFGAPPPRLEWPLDCIVRPYPAGCEGQGFVLNQVFTAGALDARLIEGISALEERIPHVIAYREFLRLVESSTGIPFVEVVVPPTTSQAANAVGRVMYVHAWTGDPDPSSCGIDPGDAEYVPLEEIYIHRSPRGLVAEVAGQRIWPVYHATRIPTGPWRPLVQLLLRSAPVRAGSLPRLRFALDLVPGAPHVPRLYLEDNALLSLSQWRVPRQALWDRKLGLGAKARRLEALRVETGIPRWVFVSSHEGLLKRLPLDLESLPGIRLLDRLVRLDEPEELFFEEMLPSPWQLPFTDLAHKGAGGSVFELMIRIPHAATPKQMAETTVGKLRADDSIKVRA